jgi:hypothetical protein
MFEVQITNAIHTYNPSRLCSLRKKEYYCLLAQIIDNHDHEQRQKVPCSTMIAQQPLSPVEEGERSPTVKNIETVAKRQDGNVAQVDVLRHSHGEDGRLQCLVAVALHEKLQHIGLKQSHAASSTPLPRPGVFGEHVDAQA